MIISSTISMKKHKARRSYSGNNPVFPMRCFFSQVVREIRNPTQGESGGGDGGSNLNMYNARVLGIGTRNAPPCTIKMC
jgi:hypothetical protein